jgi:sugar phosphate permease
MAVVMFVTTGTFFYGFSTLVDPLNEEFGWSRAAIGGAFSLRSEMGGLEAPVVGYLIDRLGSRILLISGITLVGLGFIFLSRANAIWGLYLSVGVIALGMGATGGAVAYTSVAHWFVKKRGRATAIVTLGGGAGGIMVVVLAALISAFGWRSALLVTGIAQVAVGVPIALSVRERPEDMGLLPDGEKPASKAETGEGEETELEEAQSASIHSRGLTMGQALRQRAFWMLALAMAFTSLGTTGLVVHQVSYLKKSVGFSGEEAAAVATAMTIVSLFGRLGFGYFADFVSKKKLLAGAYILIAVGMLVFANLRSPWQVVFYLALFSPGWGASIAVRPVLQSEYFGLRAFAGIQGLMFAISGIGAVLGPIFVGGTFDLFGDYRPAFLITACTAFAAAPLVLFMPSPKAEEERAPMVVADAEAEP